MQRNGANAFKRGQTFHDGGLGGRTVPESRGTCANFAVRAVAGAYIHKLPIHAVEVGDNSLVRVVVEADRFKVNPSVLGRFFYDNLETRLRDGAGPLLHR